MSEDTDHVTTFQAVAVALAAALPEDGWTQADAPRTETVLLTAADGRQLFFSTAYNGRGRFEVAGLFPRWDRQEVRPDSHRSRPVITMSLDRPEATLVREIQRRLLPEYNAGYHAARAIIARRQAARENAEGLRDRLVAAGAIQYGSWMDGIHVGQGPLTRNAHFSAQVTDDHVQFTSLSVPGDLAEAIVRLIHGQPAPAAGQ